MSHARFMGLIGTLLFLVQESAWANPRGGTVVQGSATISGTGTPGVIIQQTTPSAIINWQSFNIGAGESTRFNQPNAQSVILNRVTGERAPSSIFGSLTAPNQRPQR